MQVQMEYGLPRCTPIIDHQAKGLFHAGLSCNLAGYPHQVPEERFIRLIGIGQFSDWLTGDNQHMHRCLGGDVINDDALIVFIENLGRNFSVNNPCEKRSVALLQTPTSPESPRLWDKPNHWHGKPIPAWLYHIQVAPC
jgi:hypothetical protein